MPTSDNEGKDWALSQYKIVNPTYVLDVGVGDGTYARLCRRHDVKPTVWIGIEAWGPYIADYKLHEQYDEVLVADVRYFDFNRLKFHQKDTILPAKVADLAIIGDVLEHMPATDACQTIRDLQRNAKAVMVSVPLAHHCQGPVNGNPFERHIAHWTHQEMMDFLRPSVHLEGQILGYYLWRSALWQ